MSNQIQRDLQAASRTISRQQKENSELREALYQMCKNHRGPLSPKKGRAKEYWDKFGLSALRTADKDLA